MKELSVMKLKSENSIKLARIYVHMYVSHSKRSTRVVDGRDMNRIEGGWGTRERKKSREREKNKSVRGPIIFFERRGHRHRVDARIVN